MEWVEEKEGRTGKGMSGIFPLISSPECAFHAKSTGGMNRPSICCDIFLSKTYTSLFISSPIHSMTQRIPPLSPPPLESHPPGPRPVPTQKPMSSLSYQM